MGARVALVVAVAGAGCSQVSPLFQCELDRQCVLDGVEGRCEFKGVCSYPAEDCPSRRRYGPGAGSLSGLCVGSEPDASPLEPDAPPGVCVPEPEVCGDGIDQDCIGDPADPLCAENDFAEGAVDVSDGGVFFADLRYAHDDHAPGCGSEGGRDVYYQLDLPAEEVVYLDTEGTDFPVVLSVYPSPCTALDPGLAACVRDACDRPELALFAGPLSGTNCVVVDQLDQATAAFGNASSVLRVTRTYANGPQGGGTGDTCGLPDTVAPSCGSGESMGDSAHWQAFCEPERMTTAHTCATGSTFDSVLHVHAGSPGGPEVACDDDACGNGGSYLGATLEGPGIYWFVVDGKDGGCGAYELTIE